MISHDLDRFLEKRRWMILTGLAAWVVSYAFAYYMSARQGSMYDPSFNYESVFTAAFIISMFALALPYQASGKPLSKLLMGIGQNTFGIFVIHKIFIWIIDRHFEVFSFGERLATCLVVLAASYLVTILMNRVPILKKMVMQ
jgi:surface polysaccharide O-acyltransferase-like enzyme